MPEPTLGKTAQRMTLNEIHGRTYISTIGYQTNQLYCLLLQQIRSESGIVQFAHKKCGCVCSWTQILLLIIMCVNLKVFLYVFNFTTYYYYYICIYSTSITPHHPHIIQHIFACKITALVVLNTHKTLLSVPHTLLLVY